MQTYTHYLITAALDSRLRPAPHAAGDPSSVPKLTWRDRLPPLASGWFLLGSVAPDLPLILITLVFLGLDLAQGCSLSPDAAAQATSPCLQPDGQPGSRLGYLFDFMFFQDPWIKLAHNLMHAPLMVLAMLGLGYWVWQARQRGWAARLFWFGLSCLLHTAIDIPLHYDDGPLLFFPLEWETRFYSPLSYWDPARYGTQFAIFEHLLALGLVLYLIGGWLRRRRNPTPENSP